METRTHNRQSFVEKLAIILDNTI